MAFDANLEPAQLAIATIVGLNLLLTAYVLHKVRRVHLMLYPLRAESAAIAEEARAVYPQIEALQNLYLLLKLTHPLPALRGWAGSPDFLLVLAQHVLENKPTVILECSSGSSTLVLARCLQILGRGKVFSLEHDPHYAERTRLLLRQHGMEQWATVIDAPLVAKGPAGSTPWYSLDALPDLPAPAEMLVVDGPPAQTGPLARLPALPALRHLLAERYDIFLDDADRTDEIVAVQRWCEGNPRLRATTIECEKGCAHLTVQ